MNSIATKKVSTRLPWIDWSKAILIFMMVLCHAGVPGLGHELILSVNMPAFFLISGYLFRPHGWKEDLISILVPIAVFSLIRLIEYIILAETLNPGAIKYDLNFVYQGLAGFYRRVYPGHPRICFFTGVWFLVCLLATRLIYTIPQCLKYYKWIGIAGFVYMIFEKYFIGDHVIQYYYLYRLPAVLSIVSLGMYAKEMHFDLTKVSWKVVLALFIGYIVLFRANHNVDMLMNNYGRYNYVFFYLAMLFGSIVLFRICTLFKTSQIVIILSKGTFVILGLHQVIITSCRAMFPILEQHKALKPYILTLVVGIISYFAILLIEKYCPILMGKVSKK